MGRRYFLEPLLMMILELNDLPALIRLALALQHEVMVEESGKIDRYLLTLRDVPHRFHLILPGNRIGTAGVRDWPPGRAIPIPQISPSDFIIIILDPINDDDVFTCVILLVDDLSYVNIGVGYEDRDAFLLVVLDGIF